MSTVCIEPLFQRCRIENPRFRLKSLATKPSSLNYSPKPLRNGGSFCNFKSLHGVRPLGAASIDTALFETTDVFFKETFILKRTEVVCTFANFSPLFLYFPFSCWSLFGCFESIGKTLFETARRLY